MSGHSSSVKAKELFSLASVVPVITIERASDAVPLARSLVAGGLRVMEITLRTAAALEAVGAIIAEVPEAIVGIRTVLTPKDLESASQIGAAFAISPGATIDLLEAAAFGTLPYVPGIQTASDLTACITRGFNMVKFFPAVPAGGIGALNALAGPFPSVRFCPTGGIGEANAQEWLSHPKVIAVGGSWVTPAKDIQQGAWQLIERRAREASLMIRGGRRS